MIENKIIKEIQITKEEAKRLDWRREIDGVRFVIVDKLGDMTKTDCFAFREKNGHKSCYCLNKLYCKNSQCKFYKRQSDTNNIPIIEKEIRDYCKKRRNLKEHKHR